MISTKKNQFWFWSRSFSIIQNPIWYMIWCDVLIGSIQSKPTKDPHLITIWYVHHSTFKIWINVQSGHLSFLFCCCLISWDFSSRSKINMIHHFSKNFMNVIDKHIFLFFISFFKKSSLGKSTNLQQLIDQSVNPASSTANLNSLQTPPQIIIANNLGLAPPQKKVSS